MKNRALKRIISLIVLFTIIGSYFFWPTSTVQAEEVKYGDVTYKNVVLPGSYYTYSNDSVQNFEDIRIVPAPGKKITKVVARSKSGTETVLTQSSSNVYKLNQMTGTLVNLTGSVSQWDSSFTWFRAPSPDERVWMYDLEGIRHYFLNNGIYGAPQPNARYVQQPIPSNPSAPLPSFSNAQNVSDGNTGWTVKKGLLPAYLQGDSLSFPVEKLNNLDPKIQYYWNTEQNSAVLDGFVLPNDILQIEQPKPQDIDFASRQLTFRYKARFVVEPSFSRDQGSGLVNQYLSRWKVNLSSKVYKYETRTIYYYQEPTEPLTKPDLVPDLLAADKECIAVGETATLSYRIVNIGTASGGYGFGIKIKANGSNYKDDVHEYTMPLGGSVTKTFTYKFTSTQSVTFEVIADSFNDIIEADETNNTISKTFTAAASCSGTGGGGGGGNDPEVVNADFSFEKTTVYYGTEPISIQPVVSVVGGGCSLKEISYDLKQGSKEIPKAYTTNTVSKANLYTPYPYWGATPMIGVGSVEVTMHAITSCGTDKVVGPKTVTVVMDPNNRPPVFEAAWFKGNDTFGYIGNKIDLVEVDGLVSLRIAKDPLANPPKPYDPDGDPITYEWDFAGSTSSWIRSLPSKYGFNNISEGFTGIKADVAGSHSIKVTARDPNGGESSYTVTLNVVPPNPVPVITGPSVVVEGRPLPSNFSSAQSYSPIPGRTIDHSKDVWTNVRTSYSTIGVEYITLDVTDNHGVKSLPEMQARHALTVIEDKPPIAILVVPAKGVRNKDIIIKNGSYSPDEDIIVRNTVTVRYDSNNDGVFSENPTTLAMDANQNIRLNLNKVGKYELEVYVQEEYGRDARRKYILEIVNTEPEVNFQVNSTVSEPFVIPSTAIPVADFKNGSWVASQSATGGTIPNNWTVESQKLVSPEFKVSSFRFGGSNYRLARVFTNRGPSQQTWEYVGGKGNFFVRDEYEGWCGYSRCTYQRLVLSNIYTGFTDEKSSYSEYMAIFNLGSNRVYAPLAGQWNMYNLDQYFSLTSPPIIGKTDTEPRPDRTMKAQDFRYYQNGAPWATTNGGFPYIAARNSDVEDHLGEAVTSLDGFKFLMERHADREIKLVVVDPAGNKIAYISLGTNYMIPSQNDVSSCKSNYVIDRIQLQDNGILQVDFREKRVGCSDNIEELRSAIYLSDVNNDLPVASYTQLYQPSGVTLGNSTYAFNLAFTNGKKEKLWSGFNFLIQNARNMLRFETDGSNVQLVRVRDGQKTILDSVSYPLNLNTSYKVVIKTTAGKHTVSINGVPILESVDSTWGSGRFGPFAEMEKVAFSDITYTDLSIADSLSKMVSGYALVNDNSISYVKNYSDVENDPAISSLTSWQFIQLSTKFLQNGANDPTWGWSGFNGYSNNSPLTSFDKVGEWRITYRETDDPFANTIYGYNNSTFAGYRKTSDPFSRNVIVHRKPISRFTVGLNGDGTLWWNDQSYDPDRWLSPTNYSTENSAYQTNRGIYAEKYKYDTPSGITVEGKLNRPTESGTYRVSKAVMDEYGAWSDWYSQNITVTITFPENKPPIADFDSPAWVYRDTSIQLINKSYDPDGDPISYAWKVIKAPYENNFSSALHPSFTIRSLGLGKDAVSSNWYIQLTVTDNKGDTATAIKPLVVINRIPTASINGPDAVLINQQRSYTSGALDMDSEDQTQLVYYWQLTSPNGVITNYSNSSLNILFNLGGTYKLDHWVVDPVGDRSNTATLLINVDDNKPPVAGFIMTPSQTYRHVPVSITSIAFDPDGIITKHEYFITRPNGSTSLWTNHADWTREYDTLGNYTIRQVVTDNKGITAETSQVLRIVNRPPTVNITTPSGLTPDSPSTNIPPFRAVWSYADADGDQQASYHFRVYEHGNNNLLFSGSGNNGSNFYDVPSGILVTGKTYYAVVTVSDGYETVESIRKYFVLNRPPVSSFTCTPNPAYEGDVINCTNTSSDPDGNPMTYHWTVEGPRGYRAEFTTTHISLPRHVTENRDGQYRITLRATDSFGKDNDNDAQGTVTVLPLTISGQVNHTAQWEQNRLNWNANSGSTIRTVNTFWAGERFDLVGLPTVTSSAGGSTTTASSITVTATGIGNANLTKQSASTWTGYISSDTTSVDLEQLADGAYNFTFTVTYSNGVTKTTTVTIYISGNWDNYFRIHRTS